jgi:hypothetical protein
MTSPSSATKHVPVMAFIFALLVQTVIVVSYITNIAASVQVNQRDLLRNEVRIDRLELVVQAQEVVLAQMREHLGAIRKVVEAMDERARNPRN